MKIDVTEFPNHFSLLLEAETKHEAATLTRMGVNCVKQRNPSNTIIKSTGETLFYMTLKIRSDSADTIPHRRN